MRVDMHAEDCELSTAITELSLVGKSNLTRIKIIT